MGCAKSKPTTLELSEKYKIPESQVKTYQQAFEQFDKNKDGKISASELFEVMKSLGYQEITQATANDMIKGLNKSNSGVIDFSEFVQILVSTPTDGNKQLDQHQASMMFDVFDKNKDGYISKEELKQTMASVGVNLTDQQINEMMDEADKNKDGKISKDEFKSAYERLMKHAG